MTTKVPNSMLGVPHAEEASPESFGAVGDGVTDDSTAIQAAIDSGKRIVGTPGARYLVKSASTSRTGRSTLTSTGQQF